MSSCWSESYSVVLEFGLELHMQDVSRQLLQLNFTFQLLREMEVSSITLWFSWISSGGNSTNFFSRTSPTCTRTKSTHVNKTSMCSCFGKKLPRKHNPSAVCHNGAAFVSRPGGWHPPLVPSAESLMGSFRWILDYCSKSRGRFDVLYRQTTLSTYVVSHSATWRHVRVLKSHWWNLEKMLTLFSRFCDSFFF